MLWTNTRNVPDLKPQSFFHAMQRFLDFHEFLQMAVEAHRWATMLVHEYRIPNFIRCMTCSSGSGMKAVINRWPPWFLKCKKMFKIQLKPFPKQQLVLIPTNTSFQGEYKKTHKFHSSGPTPVKNQPGNYSCIFVCIRIIWCVGQLGLTFVLSNNVKPVWGYFMERSNTSSLWKLLFLFFKIKSHCWNFLEKVSLCPPYHSPFVVDDLGLAFPWGQMCFWVHLSLFLLDLICSQKATLVVALQEQIHRLHSNLTIRKKSY